MVLFDRKAQEMKRDLEKAGVKVAGRRKLELKKITGKQLKSGGKRLFSSEGKRKERLAGISQRARATTNILKAMGVTGGRPQRSGAGRPTGTYKYGMPIQEYKRLQRQNIDRYRQYQQEQVNQYNARGISPEQLKQMQLSRTVEQGMPRQRVIEKGDEPEAMVDDELEFKRWEAKKMLSPSANRILTRLRRVQNKGKSDNIRMQRILEERRIINHKADLMKAHENMIDVSMDFTGVPKDNILLAPSVFKEDPENNILRPKRLNILQTKEAGNNLFL